jgi:transketolase
MDDVVSRLEEMAKRMRLNALKMALVAGNNGAHIGPALSCIEILAVLYGTVMRFDPYRPLWDERDRFIASKAHCVLAHYAALKEAGFLCDKDLETFEKNGSFLAGHPAVDLSRGLEYSGGSLGLALSVGIGMAIDADRHGRSNRVFILLGDGECDEGSNWEAFLAAPHFRLDNLTVIIDQNRLQYDGFTNDIMNLGNLQQKLTDFGWNVVTVDGHSIKELMNAFALHKAGMPQAIIAKTIKGKGVSFMEGRREWHHAKLSPEQYQLAVSEVRAK